MMENKKGFTPHLSQKDGVKPMSFLRKKGAGFTLIELLIVIAIITILAAAVIVGINPARHFRATRNATRWSHMNTIATAIYSYAVEHYGNFPPGCIGESGSPMPITGDWCTGEDKVVPDYLRAIPQDPLPGKHYQIEFTDAARTAIKITSTAEEAREVFLIQ